MPRDGRMRPFVKSIAAIAHGDMMKEMLVPQSTAQMQEFATNLPHGTIYRFAKESPHPEPNVSSQYF